MKRRSLRGLGRTVPVGVVGRNLCSGLRGIEVQVGLGVRRFDQHHTDAEVAHLVVQRFRHALDRVFRRGVQTHVWGGQEAQHRTHIDDAPGPLPSHVGQHGLGHTNGAEHIGVEQRLGLCHRGFLDRAQQGATCAVDQHVDALGLADDEFDRSLHGAFVAHVHFDELDARDGFRLAGIPNRAEHLAAALDELRGGGTSDA